MLSHPERVNPLPMRKYSILKMGVAAFLALAPLSTQATAYLIDEWDSPDSGDDEQIAAIQAAIAAFNTAGNPPAPLPAFDPALVFVAKTDDVEDFDSADNQSVVWTAPSGDVSFYVLTKWGQGQANFDTALHLVTPGNTLNYNPAWGGPRQPGAPNGLSHIAIWHTPETEVPDGGTTAVLLGLGLLGIASIRRRLS